MGSRPAALLRSRLFGVGELSNSSAVHGFVWSLIEARTFVTKLGEDQGTGMFPFATDVSDEAGDILIRENRQTSHCELPPAARDVDRAAESLGDDADDSDPAGPRPTRSRQAAARGRPCRGRWADGRRRRSSNRWPFPLSKRAWLTRSAAGLSPPPVSGLPGQTICGSTDGLSTDLNRGCPCWLAAWPCRPAPRGASPVWQSSVCLFRRCFADHAHATWRPAAKPAAGCAAMRSEKTVRCAGLCALS